MSMMKSILAALEANGLEHSEGGGPSPEYVF